MNGNVGMLALFGWKFGNKIGKKLSIGEKMMARLRNGNTANGVQWRVYAGTSLSNLDFLQNKQWIQGQSSNLQAEESSRGCFLRPVVWFFSSGSANSKLAECKCFSSGLALNEWSPRCQGCWGFGSPALVREAGWRLRSALLHPPPAGQIVSLCGRGPVGWCWRHGCAGGWQFADIPLCSNVSGPPRTEPV